MSQTERLLRIGVLGCGPIAQAAHLEACRKARNAELYAVCDVAADLRERVAAIHQPRAVYADYADMLADPQVDAVIVAVADQFHVPLARQALGAGKHVLVEKPLGTSVEECDALRQAVAESGLVLQVGHNYRFDPGIAFAREFIQSELGEVLSLNAWYHDSFFRYTMTDNLQPIPIVSSTARRPDGNPKGDRFRYFLLTHGSHLVDLARYLGGEISGLRARYRVQNGAHCWFTAVDFASGALGQLDLTVPVQGDFESGFRIYGEEGSVVGTVPLPWFFKSSQVECFSAKDRQYRRVLGEDAHTYKRQIEGFASVILDGAPRTGATVEDGLTSVRTLVAIARSVESGAYVRLDEVTGSV
jgi:predicted dehydrogenase